MFRRSERVMSVLEGLFRLALGGVFIYAAIGKLQDPGLFATQVAAYRMLPSMVSGWVAIWLPAVELVAGVSLIATKWSREASLLLLGMLGVFFVGLVQAMARGLQISCGCFGEGAEGSGLGAALIRDLVMWGPAAWLALRPNGWLVGRFPWIGAVCAVAIFGGSVWIGQRTEGNHAEVVSGDVEMLDLSGFETNSTATVKAERWTTNFPAALAQARHQHRPLVMYAGDKTCHFCQHTKKVITSTAFNRWIKGTGIYLAEAHFSETNQNPSQHAQVQFMRSLPRRGNLAFPYIAVYWPRENEQENVQLLFVGRRGLMPGKRQKSLTGEFMGSVEALLKDYFKQMKRPTYEQVVGYAERKISVRAEDDSKVWMEPEDGIQPLGGKVTLFVKPKQTGGMIAWKYPDGSPVPRGRYKKLEVNDDMPAGEYRVSFRKLKSKKASEWNPKELGIETETEGEKER